MHLATQKEESHVLMQWRLLGARSYRRGDFGYELPWGVLPQLGGGGDCRASCWSEAGGGS